MDQIVVPPDAEEYVLVFHGCVPSILMARVAYRRVGKAPPVQHERKVIKCPYCSIPFTDVDKDTKVELYCYPARKQVRCQVYSVCHNCKNEVGMILV